MENIISFTTSVFWFAIVISVIVFIHEYGHYWVARKCGVKVEIFSIGFGKAIWKRKAASGTEWQICVLPLGGFVKMFGDSSPASNPDFESLGEMSEKDKQQSFFYKPLWQKALVVAAGPIANFMLAIFIFTCITWSYGKISGIPEVSHVNTGSPAEKAGIIEGDLILSADGEKIEALEELKQHIALNTGTSIALEILREDTVIVLDVKPELQEFDGGMGGKVKMAVIGIVSNKVKREKVNIAESFIDSTVQAYQMSASILKAIGQMVTGQRDLAEMGGPLKIAQYSAKSASMGITNVLWLVAVISLNLGLINLLPIPMLDGGHLAYYSIEAINGKPLSEKVQNIGFKIGFIMLISLMIFATFNDIRNIFS